VCPDVWPCVATGCGRPGRSSGPSVGNGCAWGRTTFLAAPARAIRSAHGNTPGLARLRTTSAGPACSRYARRACATSTGSVNTGTP
jgi:hypothetical protein